ncbi:hypothetical protein TcasGA2_TC002605 [Tribolium castaneum]|uniref:Uncharacterized protein n=1 Tax=Tribolium castaneum TaxID=7070 RepID=D6WFG3_TRICA|nr:hypothetical protein TcasGA2_TC002605 [Tribolium castaneum]
MPGWLSLAHALFLPTHNHVFCYYHQEIIKIHFGLNEIDIKCDSNDSCVILSRQFPSLDLLFKNILPVRDEGKRPLICQPTSRHCFNPNPVARAPQEVLSPRSRSYKVIMTAQAPLLVVDNKLEELCRSVSTLDKKYVRIRAEVTLKAIHVRVYFRGRHGFLLDVAYLLGFS